MNETTWTPEQLFEISGNYWKACTLHAAVKLDLFSAINSGPVTAQEVAQKLGTSERGITMLLNALAAMQLLTKTADTYNSTQSSKALLSKASADYVGNIILHHRELVNAWSQLDQSVTTGEPVRQRIGVASDPDAREHFLMGMFNLANRIAPNLVKQLDLSNRHHLLDLGGGPGTYALHFCRHNPQLKATIFDLPTTAPFANKTIEKFELADRVNFVDGNFLEDTLPGRYDAAWLSQILHGEGLDDCHKLIRKVVSVMEPGGIVMIHEFMLANTMDGPLFPALFSLNMLTHTEHGQSYSEEQLMTMLSSSGLRDVRRLSMRGPNDSGVVLGVVP